MLQCHGFGTRTKAKSSSGAGDEDKAIGTKDLAIGARIAIIHGAWFKFHKFNPLFFFQILYSFFMSISLIECPRTTPSGSRSLIGCWK